MLTKVTSVAVLVTNAEKSAEWYRDKLGFEVVSMQGHWVAVKPKDSSTILHLCAKCNEWGDDKPGGQTGVAFESDKKEETYRELRAKGVEFSQELHTEWFGTYAIFRDPDGNEFWM